jgi:hypothetical protein
MYTFGRNYRLIFDWERELMTKKNTCPKFGTGAILTN